MGSVFKKAVTRPLPPNAEIIERQGVRLARWRDGKGQMRTAPSRLARTGTDRIRESRQPIRPAIAMAKDRSSKSRPDAGTRARAQSVLADLERRAERVRSNSSPPPKIGSQIT